MKNIMIIIWSFLPGIIAAQTIDWDNFSEDKMNEVMFSEMNEYVKSQERRDSVKINPEDLWSKYRAYDWHDFNKTDKELMSEDAKWRTGDSLILSKVIQDQIMPRNRGFIKKNSFRPLDGKTNQPDPLSPKQTDHWKPGSIDPLLFDKNSKELFLSQRA